MTTITIAKSTTTDSVNSTLPRNPADILAKRIKRILTRLVAAYEISAERRELSKLTPEQLQDIGISQGQANRECKRSFLDLPQR